MVEKIIEFVVSWCPCLLPLLVGLKFAIIRVTLPDKYPNFVFIAFYSRQTVISTEVLNAHAHLK